MGEEKKDQPKELKSDVAKKYKLREHAPVHGFFAGFGEIDLSELSLSAIEELVKRGFKWLEEVKATSNDASPAKTGK